MVDLEQLLPALSRAGIEFIIVGGVAAIVHGSAHLTQDLDIVHRRKPDNIRPPRNCPFTLLGTRGR